MKITPHFSIWFVAASFLFASDLLAQVTVTGYVRTMTGVPISGAQATLVKLNLTAVTNDSGFYDFSKTNSLRPLVENPSRFSFSLARRKSQLIVTLDRDEKVTIRIFDVAGNLVRRLDDRFLVTGSHAIDVGKLGHSNAAYIARCDAGEKTASIIFAYCQGEITGLSQIQDARPWPGNLSKSAAAMASDSLIVTHPNYWGGLDGINTRKISSTTGTQNFRMFSNDTSSTGWYASTMNFVFTPDSPGVSYYQQKVPDYKFEERQTQREIEQCFWRSPADVPTSKRYSTYTCNINGNSGVPSGDAATTGGNTLNFNPSYINGKSWWEILGVQHHEMNHSYQPWYDMTGVTAFGESMPDCIRCLTGFFYWPAGTKCSGGINQAYQPGAHYWYFIELKHPGFIYGLYKLTSKTNIATAVQQVTGESLDTLCKQCEAQGMPYTLGHGSF